MKFSKTNIQIPSNGTTGLAKKIKGVLVTKTVQPVSGKEQISNSRFEYQLKADKMIGFMRPLADFIDQINIRPHIVSPGLRRMLNHNIQHAIKGCFSDLKIDYSQLIVSKGELPNAPGISVSSPKEGKLLFRWTDNSGIGKARASDLVFVAVFNRETKRWIFAVDIVPRLAQHCQLNVHPFRFKKVQPYIGFVSENSLRISTSVYVGEVHVL